MGFSSSPSELLLPKPNIVVARVGQSTEVDRFFLSKGGDFVGVKNLRLTAFTFLFPVSFYLKICQTTPSRMSTNFDQLHLADFFCSFFASQISGLLTKFFSMSVMLSLSKLSNTVRVQWSAGKLWVHAH